MNRLRETFCKKKLLVVGLGLSGLWAARWLAGQGSQVTISEERPEAQLNPRWYREMLEIGVVLETGGHRQDTFLNADMIVTSPGVRNDLMALRAARDAGIPVVAELELASRLTDIPIIAVTGTNGKSTVTAFIGFLLKKAGVNAFIGGNIGIPLMAFVAGGGRADYLVVEVSSFQLEGTESFAPFVSLLLNLSPDHLDRYADFESYIRAKLKIFENQGMGKYLILNNDDKTLATLNPSSGVSVLRYGLHNGKGLNASVEDKRIWARGSTKQCFSLASFRLPGIHNVQNLLAVVLTCLILGIDSTVIQAGLSEFNGLPNRLERVGELEGVKFYNDSKATNVDATLQAVLTFDRPIILIAGGRHKGADYGPLVRKARGKVKKAIFLGEARERMARAFKGKVPFDMVQGMEEAVRAAYSWANKGDVVLLSPACSSFDMFSDYAERGEAFRAAVRGLISGQE